MPTTTPRELPDHADLLIVGAGVAGLYTAWRYLQEHPDDDVVIVERLNRPGGRLQSDHVEIEAHNGEVVTVREEEGGMRFNYTMRELMALFGALDLCDQIVPFPMSGSNNRYYFRGRGFTDEQAAADPAIWSELFDLKPEERNRAPVDILASAFNRILRANGVAHKPADAQPGWWQTMRLEYEWDGTPLYKWQLWGLLRDMGYSEGCCQMLTHTLGFEGPFLSRMNAGEAFQLLEDFPADPTYYTFREGFSTLPNALVDAVESLGGRIFLSVNVDQIDAADDDGYDLRCTIAPEYESSHPQVPGGRQERIHGDSLVLAVARKALEGLYQASPPLNRRDATREQERESAYQLWQDLQTTTNQRLLKINLYFREAWWRKIKKPVQYGPSFSDLPVGSVYPFYSLEKRLASGATQEPPAPDLPAALTIYCDWDNTNFWQGLQGVGPKFDSPLQRTYSQKEPQRIFPASEAVVEEARQLFRLLYNTPDVPEPVMTSFRLWDGEHDFGYAVHQWGLDARDDEVMKRLVEPVDGIYTCNEAYSDMQGWVNGSLRSADRVLKSMGITPLVDEASNTPCPAPTSGPDSDGVAAGKHVVGRWAQGVR